ncbi:hypothetical protein CN918_30380 [Priestia megaterium]|nr:hypothetical protein CN918_30380 [Priestia megaterium]
MKVADIFQQVLSADVDKIMHEWFPYLWTKDEDNDCFPENYCNDTLFTLRNMTPSHNNLDTVNIAEGLNDGIVYRELHITHPTGRRLNYTFRTWDDFLALTISSDCFLHYSKEEITAVLLAELPLNRTEEQASDMFYSLKASFEKLYYQLPEKQKSGCATVLPLLPKL